MQVRSWVGVEAIECDGENEDCLIHNIAHPDYEPVKPKPPIHNPPRSPPRRTHI